MCGSTGLLVANVPCHKAPNDSVRGGDDFRLVADNGVTTRIDLVAATARTGVAGVARKPALVGETDDVVAIMVAAAERSRDDRRSVGLAHDLDRVAVELPEALVAARRDAVMVEVV